MKSLMSEVQGCNGWTIVVIKSVSSYQDKNKDMCVNALSCWFNVVDHDQQLPKFG
jgi:hypothetical protein